MWYNKIEVNNMKVAVLGTGAYGLALASVLHEHHEVVMWSRFEEEILELRRNKSSFKLPDYMIPSDIVFTTDMKQAIKDSLLIVIAVPSIFVEDVVKDLQSLITNQHLCVASKGMVGHFFLSDIILKYIPMDRLAIISGPSFAIDMIKKVPIGLSLGTQNPETSSLIQSAFERVHFCVTDDIHGIEICGSIKNVIAIGAGILKGMGFSDSTSALYITKSLHDIQRLIDLLGGNSSTILSLAGIGDLLLTCTSSQSRNFSFGYLIGNNANEKEIILYKNLNTIEGLDALYSMHLLIQKSDISFPILECLYDIIENKKPCELLKQFLIQKK